jgi:hypothetical protein
MKTCAGKTAFVFFFLPVAWLSGCRAFVRVAPHEPASAPPPPVSAELDVARPGYAIQIGAFSFLDNARRAAEALNGSGLEAYCFRQETGIYKVRFGNFRSRGAADREAKRLRNEAIIEDYFIVYSEDRPVIRPDIPGDDLRNRLAATAESFIGVDYSWGGATSREGFDCSGLVKEVYELNGLSLPRSVADQYRAGTTVSEGRLLKGDLVFFSTVPGGPLSHVGICVGAKSFIHAPGKGKKVREESLDNAYFREHFSGARAYLK